MFCREWTLVKSTDSARLAKPLTCKSWGCEYCQPTRRAQLMAKAASGLPNRFLTLTCNPAYGDSPYHRLRLLSHAWNVIVKRLRRVYGVAGVQYLAVVEATKRGEPHLHILLRSPFIPHDMLSQAMDELTHAPVVDIRKIRNTAEVVRYVAKYVAKRPAQFGTAKRYWQSKDYEPDYIPPTHDTELQAASWAIVRVPIDQIVALYLQDGYSCRNYDETTLYFLRMGEESLEPPKGKEVPP